MCCGCMSDICLIIISVFFPPLPVWIRRGVCSCDSLINIALCILGYFPGLIHSWYIIAKYPPYNISSDSKIYYVFQAQGDLESQRERRSDCVHHHHHTNHYNDSGSGHGSGHGSGIATEPQPLAGPSYGATNDSGAPAKDSKEQPPAYTEFAPK